MDWRLERSVMSRNFRASCDSRTYAPREIDRRGPDHAQDDAVLDAVKAWPGDGGTWGTHGTTAILDRGCAWRHLAKAVGTKKRLSDRAKN